MYNFRFCGNEPDNWHELTGSKCRNSAFNWSEERRDFTISSIQVEFSTGFNVGKSKAAFLLLSQMTFSWLPQSGGQNMNLAQQPPRPHTAWNSSHAYSEWRKQCRWMRATFYQQSWRRTVRFKLDKKSRFSSCFLMCGIFIILDFTV